MNAQENAFYITYGRQSPITAGDDNYKQAFFIKVSESAPDNFYIRIFDPDCYGSIDQEVAVYNTETIFSLFGINNIMPNEKTNNNLDIIESESGKLLYKKIYSNDFELDNKWVTYVKVDKKNGELVNGHYNFKLLVEGGYGTDGNIFDLFISGNPDSNQPVNGIDLFSYAPTLRNNKLFSSTQVKFNDGFDGKYTLHNFDMDGAELNFDTPFRSNLALNASGDGVWTSSIIELSDLEKGNPVGINFARFKDNKNDVTLYISDNNSNIIPLPLPIYYKRPNNRPVPIKQVYSSEQWNKKTFDASLSKDADGDQMEFIWHFGDGSSLNGINVSHQYEKSGEYNCILIAKDKSGSVENSSYINFTVKLNQPPVADAGKDILVSSSEVNFDASASDDPDGKISNYFWDFGDGSTDTGMSVKHIYSNPGIYKVNLQVTDDSQLPNNKNTTSINVIINKKPIADAGPDIVTEPGKEISFSGINSIDPDGEIISYMWDFGDGSSGEGKQINHTFLNPGNYTVRLQVTDNTNHEYAIDYDDALVIVNNRPAAYAGPDIIAAPGQEIEFSGNTSYDIDGGKLDYFWEFSDGKNNSDKQIIKRSFLNPGLYTVVLTVKDFSGAVNNKSSDTVSIRINNSPTAIIGNDIITCSSLISFDASDSFDPDGDLLTYNWDFGDGTPLTNGIKVSHEYKTKGSFPVVLTVDDRTGLNNSKNNVSITVLINKPPVAEAGEDLVICAGEFVPFDGGKSFDPENGLLKYSWDFGDGTFAEGINPVKSYYKGGVFQVKLTVEDDSGLKCSKDIDTKIITVIESPVANAGEDMEVCAFEEIRFDGTKSTDADGVVNNYTWDFGDGTTGGGASPKHTYTKAGIYKVVLSITGETIGQCDNSSADELTVIVNEAPEAVFASVNSAPVNSIVKFDASNSNGKSDNIVSYEWDYGDGNTGTGKTADHTYGKSGLYFVTLKVTTDSKSNCNSSSFMNSILINEAPEAFIESDSKIKLNSPAIFSALKSNDKDGAIINYKWNFGDGSTAEGVYAEHTYSKPGKYNVSLKVTDNSNLPNNTHDNTFTIDVYEDYRISFQTVEFECPGKEIQFNSIIEPALADSLVNYSWEISDGTILTGKNVSYVFSNPGNYNISLIAESELFDNEKTKIYSKEIIIISKPVIEINKQIYSCTEEEIILDASKSYKPDKNKLEFKWEIDGEVKSGSIISHKFNKPGNYTVKLIADDGSGFNCGITEEEIKIFVNSSPIAVTQKNISGFTGGAYDAVLFDASESFDKDGDALTYSWDFGDGKKGSGSKVYHYYKNPGAYSATLKISDGRINACGITTERIKINIQKR